VMETQVRRVVFARGLFKPDRYLVR
jgi:hypothetical protein